MRRSVNCFATNNIIFSYVGGLKSFVDLILPKLSACLLVLHS